MCAFLSAFWQPTPQYGHSESTVRSAATRPASRAGISAPRIAITHWGFAAIGGLAALAFTHSPAWAKPALALSLVLPQWGWTLLVVRRARNAQIGKW